MLMITPYILSTTLVTNILLSIQVFRIIIFFLYNTLISFSAQITSPMNVLPEDLFL